MTLPVVVLRLRPMMTNFHFLDGVRRAADRVSVGAAFANDRQQCRAWIKKTLPQTVKIESKSIALRSRFDQEK